MLVTPGWPRRSSRPPPRDSSEEGGRPGARQPGTEPENRSNRSKSTQPHIITHIRRCVVLVSCNHSFNERSHSVNGPGATGFPEAERPQGRKPPAQVPSGGWPEPSQVIAPRPPTGKVKPPRRAVR